MGSITVRDASGRAYDIPEEQLGQYTSTAGGFHAETPDEQAARTAAEHQTAEYGGAAGTIAAAGAGALSTATGGLSDVAIAGLGGGHTLRALKEENPIASTLGSVAGGLIPGGFGGLAARAGSGIAEGLGGGILARAAGGAAEGALFGAGGGVSELALSQDPVTWENAASTLSSSMLFGGAIGGGLGLAGAAVERGLVGARKAIDARLTGAATDGQIAAVSPDLLTLDAPALKAAREAEVTQLETAREPVKTNAVEELDEYRNANRDSHWMRAISDASGERDLKEAGASFVSADFGLRKLLDNRAYLADNPKAALRLLTQQQQALDEIIPWGQAQAKAWAADVEAAPTKIRAQIVAKEVPGEIGPFTPAGLDAAVQRELADRSKLAWGPSAAIKDGLKPPPFVAHAEQFQRIAERNRQLQEQFKSFASPVTSDRLKAIDAAREALSLPREKSVSERLLSHVPGGGLVSELAGLGSKAVGGLRKASATVAEQTGKAITTFLGAADKVAPVVTPTATQVLSRVRFGAGPEPKSAELHDIFAARSAELRQQTMVAPDGSIQMRPEARAQITAALRPVAASDPLSADRLETALAARTAYMSSKLPKRPEVGGLQVGPDNWRPSDLQMRSWARTVRACEDPHGVEVRLAQGIVTPEESDAYRTCYPARFQALQGAIFQAAPQLAKTLPTRKKIALYVFTGVPTMAALQPNVLQVLQSTFAVEPGTAGGTQAPRPMPSFGALGSTKATDDATPAQKRGA